MGVAAHSAATAVYRSTTYAGNWALQRGAGASSKKVPALDFLKGSFRELNGYLGNENMRACE